jgi:hypothetical protein
LRQASNNSRSITCCGTVILTGGHADGAHERLVVAVVVVGVAVVEIDDPRAGGNLRSPTHFRPGRTSSR